MTPLPDDLSARPAGWEDRAAVHELMCRVDLADLGEVDTTLDDLEWRWSRPSTDLDEDSVVVHDGGGSLVGYLLVWQSGAGKLYAESYADPGPRRADIDAFLLLEAYARAQRRADDTARSVRLIVPAAEGEPRIPVLERDGFAAARWFMRMERRLDTVEPLPRAPDGLRIGPLPHPDDAALAAVHAAVEEAFTDHWEHEAVDLADWRARHVEVDGFDPSMWWVASDGDHVAGAAIGVPEPQLGGLWIPIVAVRRRWRRRGLAGALLRTLFSKASERGDLPTAALLVDADSPTGATRVYERAGMVRRWAVAQMARDIHPSAR